MMEFHKSKFKTYLLDLVLFCSLLLIGTLYYSWLNLYEVEKQVAYHIQTFEDDKFTQLDAYHFSVVTATTVGYGDVFPHTTNGKIFGSAFIIFGVSLFARVIGSIFGHIQATFEHGQKERMFSRAMSSVENLREFDEDGDGKIDKYEFLKTMLIKRGDVEPKVIEDIMYMFNRYDADGSGFIETDEIRDIIKRDYDRNMACIVANDKKLISMAKRNLITADACTNTTGDEYADDEDEKYNEMSEFKEEKISLENVTSYSDLENEEIEERKIADDEDMFYVLNVELIGCDNLRVIDEQAEKTSENFWEFLLALISVVIYLCFGALIFSYVESKDFGSMLWFLVVTSCTVGYGDISPQTSAGKYLNSLFIICNLLLFGYLFTQIFDYIYARQEAIAAKTKDELQRKNVNQIARNRFKSLERCLDERMICESNIFWSIISRLRKQDAIMEEKIDDCIMISQ